MEQVRPSVVLIETASGAGSGVIYEVDGRYARMVTNFHVVGSAAEVTVTVDDTDRYLGAVLGYHMGHDLAVVQIPCANCTAASFAADVKPGAQVMAMGYPSGSVSGTATVTRGLVSAIGPHEYYLQGDVIQTDAAINPGNSGGPMFSEQGEIVGISTFKSFKATDGRALEGVGFAIPASSVQSQLPRLKEGAKAATELFNVTASGSHTLEFRGQPGWRLTYSFLSDPSLGFWVVDDNDQVLEYEEDTSAHDGELSFGDSKTLTFTWLNSHSWLSADFVLFVFEVAP